MLNFGKFVIFFTRDDYLWFDVTYRADYHNIIFSITLFTFTVGFEYIRKTAKNPDTFKKIHFQKSIIKDSN